jgi:hypothetical protein
MHDTNGHIIRQPGGQILFQEKISSQQEFGQKKMRFKRLSEIQMEGTLPSFGPKIFPKVQKVVPSNFQEVVKVQSSKFKVPCAHVPSSNSNSSSSSSSTIDT